MIEEKKRRGKREMHTLLLNWTTPHKNEYNRACATISTVDAAAPLLYHQFAPMILVPANIWEGKQRSTQR